jgi:adenylylsulfate kinase
MKIILIMGLPGAGKTTLANEISTLIKAKRLNADEIRETANDWDFSEQGRIRQAKRMYELAMKLKKKGDYVIADFICPTPETRKLFPADFIIWLDTIKSGRFDDTNKLFIEPKKYNFKVKTKDAKYWAPIIFKEFKKVK